MSIGVPKATFIELVRWVFQNRRRLRVSGVSMEPTLMPGDVILVDPSAYRDHKPGDGDVVVARHPQQPGLEIVKRVEFTTEEGVYLSSDNQDEVDVADSRRFGVVPFDLIVGRVTANATAKRSSTLET